MDLHYFPCNLVDYCLPLLSSRAFPISQMAILAKRCSINREFARSSLGRLPASFGGLLGFLLAALEILRLLFGRSEESAESRLGAPLGATEMRGPLGPSPLSARSAVARPPGAESAKCFTFALPPIGCHAKCLTFAFPPIGCHAKCVTFALPNRLPADVLLSRP